MATLKLYGWSPDLPDHRDQLYDHDTAINPIKKVDLRNQCPPVYNQYDLGSCTANSIGALYEFCQKKQGLKDFTPSRLFIYYNERALEGTIKQDAGAQIRNGFKCIAKQGVCLETTWPYIISKFTKKPTTTCYTEALHHQAISYKSVSQTEIALKACLNEGYPVSFGFTVYESFESQAVADSGVMPMPAKSEKSLGGHAVLLVGYDDGSRHWLVRNSWGSDWGDGGYFYMPYEYLLNPNLACDFWTLRLVESDVGVKSVSVETPSTFGYIISVLAAVLNIFKK